MGKLEKLITESLRELKKAHEINDHIAEIRMTKEFYDELVENLEIPKINGEFYETLNGIPIKIHNSLSNGNDYKFVTRSELMRDIATKKYYECYWIDKEEK